MVSIVHPWSSSTWLAVISAGAYSLCLVLAWYKRQRLARAWTHFAALAGLQALNLAGYSWVLWQWYQATPTRQTFVWSSKLPYIQNLVTAVIPLCVGWLFATVLALFLWWLFVRRTKEQFLDATDVWLVVLGVAAVGWPAALVYLAMVFLISVLGMLVLIIFRRKQLSDRLVITSYIVPAAIATLAFHDTLLRLTFIWKIGF